MLTVLELGNYVVPAYAGMILAEQGYYVEKWLGNKPDPIQECRSGDSLWQWINAGKQLRRLSLHHLATLPTVNFDIVLDNFRPSTLARWGVDPAAIAQRDQLVWVSMRSEVGERSFDLLAQARSTMEVAGHIPFWLGDTSGGLWLAFKALAMSRRRQFGHYVLGQASCLQKLVEGELQIERPEPLSGNVVPWENETYRHDAERTLVEMEYKGEKIEEPVRNREWKWSHLWHTYGRIRI